MLLPSIYVCEGWKCGVNASLDMDQVTLPKHIPPFQTFHSFWILKADVSCVFYPSICNVVFSLVTNSLFFLPLGWQAKPLFIIKKAVRRVTGCNFSSKCCWLFALPSISCILCRFISVIGHYKYSAIILFQQYKIVGVFQGPYGTFSLIFFRTTSQAFPDIRFLLCTVNS